MADTLPKKRKAASTQQFLPIEEVKEGVVKMKNGSLRAVIMVSSVNFQLKSEREKNAMISSYQGFLNSLNYPIQIMAQSRLLELDEYLEKLKKIGEEQQNGLLKAQIEQYVEFVASLIENSNLMAKRFFVVVPFFPVGVGVEKIGFLKKFLSPSSAPTATDFETQKMELMQRVDQIISSLSEIGLRCVVLNTEDLIELYYSVYNPDMANSEKLTEAEGLEAPIITSGENTSNV